MQRQRARALLLLSLLGAAACTSSTTTSTTTTGAELDTSVPTTVRVLPDSFLGQVPCSNNAGAMRSYVATLTDTTDSAHPVDLPSSPPTPCSQPVAFRYVVSGRQYTAAIDAYELTGADMTPFNGSSSGSRTMLRDADQTVVIPRWTTSCSPVTAVGAENVDYTDCDPLFDHGSATPITGIKIEPRGALGLLACAGPEAGTITSFDIHPADPALIAYLGVPCDNDVPLYATGLTDGVVYTFTVNAHQGAGGPPAYAATCSARARKGLVVVALCAPLAPAP